MGDGRYLDCGAERQCAVLFRLMAGTHVQRGGVYSSDQRDNLSTWWWAPWTRLDRWEARLDHRRDERSKLSTGANRCASGPAWGVRDSDPVRRRRHRGHRVLQPGDSET